LPEKVLSDGTPASVAPLAWAAAAVIIAADQLDS
jgi:GH15 family glucan-1,4-alpha-glucosidase